jgi:hypothetical protein
MSKKAQKKEQRQQFTWLKCDGALNLQTCWQYLWRCACRISTSGDIAGEVGGIVVTTVKFGQHSCNQRGSVWFQHPGINHLHPVVRGSVFNHVETPTVYDQVHPVHLPHLQHPPQHVGRTHGHSKQDCEVWSAHVQPAAWISVGPSMVSTNFNQ